MNIYFCHNADQVAIVTAEDRNLAYNVFMKAAGTIPTHTDQLGWSGDILGELEKANAKAFLGFLSQPKTETWTIATVKVALRGDHTASTLRSVLSGCDLIQVQRHGVSQLPEGQEPLL